MAGNSKRRGAVRRSTKGNPTAGSGGRVRRGLEGKGPTPKASERPGHKAYRQARAASARSPSPRPARRPDDAGEWVAGRNAVVEALRAGVPVTAVHVADRAERDDRLREIVTLAGDRGLDLLEVSRAALDRFTDGASHQGVAANVPAYRYAHPDDLLERATEAGRVPLVVALDGVTDPRNLGAVLRSAAAFGAHGLVVPERRAAGMTASAWKASAGAAARVPVARVTNLPRQLVAYGEQGLTAVGLAADGDVAVAELPVADQPLVLVVGGEAGGLSRLARARCDLVASIPMVAGTESLNAGVAAGIALYEVARLRG